MLYQKLEDEVKRLNKYQEETKEIFDLIRKREDKASYDTKYKSTLSGQIVIKIEEFRRSIRM